jgi:hypothetical protein
MATNIAVAPKRTTLLHALDPATALGEILFGLIMTLTFTLSAGIMIEEEGREGARQLLIAIIGCNIAWGIIDGALYLVGELFNRGRLRRLGRSIRDASDEQDATRIVARELDEIVGEVTSPTDRVGLYERIARHVRSRPATENRVTKDDVLGAVASFWLVFLASIPAAVPFILLDDARLALRISNAILLALMFFAGYWWGRLTLSKPWIVGTAFLVVGLALVIAAIALGG